MPFETVVSGHARSDKNISKFDDESAEFIEGKDREISR